MVLDKDIFEKLFYAYSPRLSSYAGRMLQDTDMADDLVQDIFVRFWEKYKDTDAEHWPSVLFTMTRNRCLDYLKHISVKHRIMGQEVADVDFEKLVIEDLAFKLEATDNDLLMAELDRKVKSISATLPPKCSEVFNLSRVEGLTNEEIAGRLGISVKSVEKHITRALRAFKKGLGR